MSIIADDYTKGTLEVIKERGYLKCGVSTGMSGFAYLNKDGVWEGFDVSFCRATAAAIFNDPSKVEFTPTTSKNRWSVLQSKEVDLLYRSSTWTLTRDSSLGLSFSVVNYYDGQGFLVKKDLGVNSARELDGATICVAMGTTTELNLARYFKDNNMNYSPIYVETFQQAISAFRAGRCDIYTTDASALAVAKSTFDNPEEYVVLPEIISKEPLGPVVRADEPKFGKLVQWVFYATVQAEEFGLTQANIDDMKNTTSSIEKFLGVEDNTAPDIGLSKDFAYRVIKHVGNYGELFEKYLGVNTKIGLQRGLNDLYTRGGLHYSPPFK